MSRSHRLDRPSGVIPGVWAQDVFRIFDPGAVDQQVQRPLQLTIRDVDGQRFLATAKRAEVGHRPVVADKAQQALDEAGRLPQRHAGSLSSIDG